MAEWDFSQRFPGSFPGAISWLASGHVVINRQSFTAPDFALVETSLDGTQVFANIPIVDPDPAIVYNGSFYQAFFADDRIWRGDLATGNLIAPINVEGFPDGFPGPYAIAPSWNGGWFCVDHFRTKPNEPLVDDPHIIEVDATGAFIREVSTGAFYPAGLEFNGRGISIATDLVGRRVFIQTNNVDIWILDETLSPTRRLPLAL